MQSMKCPCHSGESYPKCCEPFITGKTSAPTALTLMRSRYTAYAQENRDYLVATWHPETVPLDLSFDGSTVRWDSLSILSQSAGLKDDNDGYVEFEAYFHAGNQTSRMRENSHFKKLDGCWFYVDGEVDRSPNRTIATTAKVGRNQPCPCGSGKKFKKCCG